MSHQEVKFRTPYDFQRAHYELQALQRSPSISSWGITDMSGKLPVLTKATAAFAHMSRKTFCVLTRNVNCTKSYHWKQKKMLIFITYFIFFWFYPHRSFTLSCFLSFCQNDQVSHLYFLNIFLYTYFIHNSTFVLYCTISFVLWD